MRNPIRFKNLQPRFWPVYGLGLAVLALTRPSPATFALGLLPVLAGTALRAWGAGHLVKTERLTTTGPYAWLRHPLYAGTLLVAVGFVLMMGGWLGAGLALLVAVWFFASYFPRKERSEGARLEDRYGEAFRDYRAQVPALLPRLSRWEPTSRALEKGELAPVWSFDRYAENNELGALLAIAAGVSVLFWRAWSMT